MIEKHPKIVVGNKQLKECLQELQRSFTKNRDKHLKRLDTLRLDTWNENYIALKNTAFGIQSCLNYVNEFLAKLED